MNTWPRVPLRRAASIINGGTPTPDDHNWGGSVPWATPVDLATVDGGHLQVTERLLTEKGLKTGSRTVPVGSLIMSTRAPIGYLAQVQQVTAFNQGCRGLVPREGCDGRFLQYALISQTDVLQSLGTGSTFLELSTEALANVTIPLPPLDEQRRIANYLDDQTTRIDQAIQLRQQQLQLLDSRFAALVDDSIGAADEVVPLRYLAQVIIGLTYDPASVCEHSQCPIVVRAGNIQAWALDLETDDLVRVHADLPSKLRLQAGDLVVCARSGSPHLIGKSARVEGEGVGNTWGAFMIVIRSVDNDYLRWVLLSSLFQRDVGKFRTSTINQLTTNTLKEIGIPLPDSSSRRRIAADLAGEFDRARQARQVLLSGLEKLAELRRSIITEAVFAPSPIAEAGLLRGR